METPPPFATPAYFMLLVCMFNAHIHLSATSKKGLKKHLFNVRDTVSDIEK
jgi:hypothetical protein